MKTDYSPMKQWTKFFLGSCAICSLLLFTACDSGSNTTQENTKIETNPETGMGDADGVGIESSTNTDADSLNTSDTTSID